MEEIEKNNILFISKVPIKLKQAKEILKNYNEKEFVQLDPSLRTPVFYFFINAITNTTII